MKIILQDLRRSLDDTEFVRLIVQHQVVTVRNILAIDDNECRVTGTTTCKNLHDFCNGLYVSTVSVIHDLIGKNNKNAWCKDRFDQLCQRLVFDLKRNSDKRFPRCVNHFGFMDKIMVTGAVR